MRKSTRAQEEAKSAIEGVERGKRDASDRGRQSEGDIHHSTQNAAQREFIAHQHPGDEESQHDIDGGGDERQAETESERGEHARREDSVEESGKAKRRRLEHEA